jgi:Domain of unknown function (DUF4338)/DDE_Tnp_1-associated/Transposase DDE domain
MPRSVVEGLVVRPVRRDEVDRFNTELDEHHWLGHRIVGQTMRYVATEQGRWVAVLGFGSAALACAVRDRWVGWSKQQQFARLRYIVNNQRFCVLPQGRRPNLASAVLARALRRVSADYQASYGHPVLVVETFTDPVRHRGVCYAAAGFVALGQTLGYRRSAGVYVHHGNPKLAWARPLRRDALVVLSALFDHPILSASDSRRPAIDLNALELDGPDGLLATLAGLPDARKRRGIRHRQASVLAIAAVAVLAGARSYTAIGEYAAELSEDVLARLQARRHPVTGRYIAPDESTLRRAIQRVDPDALDAAVSGWLADQTRAGRINSEALAIAVDGKALRGAIQADGRPVQLFAAMIHNQGVVVAQREVDHTTNEITEFRPLLDSLDLQGAVVTADALHTQRDHAEFLVAEKGADYVFTVKGNQPGTLAAVESLFEQGSFPP